MMDKKVVSTSELKARCSEVIRDVVQGRAAVIITRRGRAVAKLVPLDEEPGSLFGFARGSLSVHGDIVEPIDVDWEAAV